jgi:hypothetical protein
MPGIPMPTNIALDISTGFWMHHLITPTVPPVGPVPVPSVEIPATQMWTLGYLTGKNVFTTTVKHRFGLPIVLDGHDLGMMIPDITIPFVNAYYAIMWPMSSRKIIFTTSIVKMDGKMVGCASIFPPFFMMSCGDPTANIVCYPVTNVLMDSVHVGMTPMDGWMGLGRAVFALALDAVFGILLPSSASPASTLSERLTSEFIQKIIPTDGNAVAKKLLEGLSGVLFPSPGEPRAYKVGVGFPGVSETELAVSSQAGVQVQRTVLGRATDVAGVGGDQGGRLRIGGQDVVGRSTPPPSSGGR